MIYCEETSKDTYGIQNLREYTINALRKKLNNEALCLSELKELDELVNALNKPTHLECEENDFFIDD